MTLRKCAENPDGILRLCADFREVVQLRPHDLHDPHGLH